VREILIRLMMLLAILSLTAGCSVVEPAGDTTRSDKERIESDATEDEIARLTDGNAAFAFDLYQILRRRDGNLFLSPYSISAALAMTYAGAEGQTEEQMAQTLHFDLEENRLHAALNAVDQILADRGEGAAGRDEEGFRLNVVNALWGQKDYSFLSAFLDTLAENYGAGLHLLDFVSAPEEARQTINHWVEEETEDRIKDLIPQGTIDTLTRLVLTNAIYFNAAWLHPFEETATTDGPFYLLDGSQVKVPMMHDTGGYGYGETDVYQAIQIPYSDPSLSMIVVVPTAGTYQEWEATLDVNEINEIVDTLTYRQVRLSLPKFEFESSFGLSDALRQLGMIDAFTLPPADFSGMTGDQDLFISEVIHKAFVSVDEAGTEAAAATAVIMATSAMPQEPVELTVDHPFLFMIRDADTGAFLFLGRVVDPTS